MGGLPDRTRSEHISRGNHTSRDVSGKIKTVAITSG